MMECFGLLKGRGRSMMLLPELFVVPLTVNWIGYRVATRKLNI